ncbi:hypothetical protein Taro_015488 [Colocasia esculenta]|uniref:Uncharacterized protein n=1 Tax=Colocasia esculenta TaxID=4460 RepID=A0A843UHN8_COLES|nr:hypothetical protein [Colocasia esculenta]
MYPKEKGCINHPQGEDAHSMNRAELNAFSIADEFGGWTCRGIDDGQGVFLATHVLARGRVGARFLSPHCRDIPAR